jgi:hypothetical protein
VGLSDERGEQAGDGLDHRDRLLAETQQHSPLGGLDVIESEPRRLVARNRRPELAEACA